MKITAQTVLDRLKHVDCLEADLFQAKRYTVGLIKEYRKSESLLQKDFAKLIGVSAQYWSEIEKGSRDLTTEVRIKILLTMW